MDEQVKGSSLDLSHFVSSPRRRCAGLMDPFRRMVASNRKLALLAVPK
jgi:hypothetical protein